MDGQDGGDFDPCECVWSHELATRRLINMLRQSQDYCTDSECFTETGAGATGEERGSIGIFLIGCWFLLAIVIYFLRPKRSQNQTKGRQDEAGPNYDPPAPPATF